MTSGSSQLLHCYNRGCGTNFDPNDNKEDSCCFHPGNPVFHDAYKGWSCCNKRSIDFTEFLNIKGCARSFHSNVKPPEPEKPKVEKTKSDEVYEYVAPTPKVSTLERPPFDSPLVRLKPEISNALKAEIESVAAKKANADGEEEVQIGTTCKNSGCKAAYEGPETNKTKCIHHSGAPVFHEGFKYWSCCNKKTTDFAVFLEQVGCTTGEHVWVKKSNNTEANCRYDWHQTGPYVYISVYAKKYDPDKSIIEINPIRVKIHLEFPGDSSQFDKDLELYGIADVDKSGVSMMPTKVEVKLKKAEPGSWAKLNFVAPKVEKPNTEKPDSANKQSESTQDDAVDLKDIN
ncbi:UNVERIFIED_CONTAM: hypothetical protein PYX00_002409 [Menopon gallinae]|uniref:Cysteine and histidine-rich domain-containing protein n=1 Tax=Menopon gallinae TaxID=328185 RepID=A0AAW2II91_9NEOP